MPDERHHPVGDHAAEDPGVWEVRVGIYATERQAEEIKDQFTRLLCPDPDHAPPCPVPWSAYVVHESDLEEPDLHAELTEQGEAERYWRT